MERDFGIPTAVAALDCELTQCVIRDHFGEGGVVVGGRLERCTVVHNVTAGGAAPLLRGTTVTSSILWANGPVTLDSTSVVSYCAVQGGAPGPGNFTAQPGTFGPGSDLRLAPGSACIDAGDPAAPLDPDGTRADVGAYPFDPNWTTAGGSFCGGPFGLTLEAPVSASQMGGLIRSSLPVTLFLLSTSNELGLTAFPAAQPEDRPQTLCLTGRILRLPPSTEPQRLSVAPALVTQLGILAGDRLLIQGWNVGVGFSQGLDVIVAP